jgi:hypothetical protein
VLILGAGFLPFLEPVRKLPILLPPVFSSTLPLPFLWPTEARFGTLAELAEAGLGGRLPKSPTSVREAVAGGIGDARGDEGAGIAAGEASYDRKRVMERQVDQCLELEKRKDVKLNVERLASCSIGSSAIEAPLNLWSTLGFRP